MNNNIFLIVRIVAINAVLYFLIKGIITIHKQYRFCRTRMETNVNFILSLLIVFLVLSFMCFLWIFPSMIDYLKDINATLKEILYILKQAK